MPRLPSHRCHGADNGWLVLFGRLGPIHTFSPYVLLFRAREQRRILRLVDPRPLRLFVRIDTRTSNEHRYCSVCKCGRVTFPFLSLFRASFPPFVASPKSTRKSTTHQHAGSFFYMRPKRGQKYYNGFLTDLLRVTGKLDFGPISLAIRQSNLLGMLVLCIYIEIKTEHC